MRNFIRHIISSNIVIILSIIVVGFAIYSNSLNSPFQFDDNGYILGNPDITSFNNFVKIFNNIGLRGRIVTLATFALNYFLHGYNVLGYHILNVIIHIVSALLVRWLIILLLSTKKLSNTYSNKDKELIALFTAFLFLCHPIQTGAVTYITQRFASLATMFYLLSVCFYIKARNYIETENKKNILFLFSGITALFAMFSKEIAFTLPVIILLIEFMFFSSDQEIKNYRLLFKKRYFNILVFLLFMFLLIVPLLFNLDIERFIFNVRAPSESYPSDVMTSYKYFITQFRVVSTYIRILVFPINQNLIYEFPLSQSIFDIKTSLGLVFLISIIMFGFYQFKNNPLIAFGIFWFFITASVESSIIPIRHIIFEHRMYLPSIGFFMSLCIVIFKLVKNRKIVIIILSVLICILSVLTFQRNKIWSSGISLWEDVAKKSPHLAKPFINLSRFYIEKGDYRKALVYVNMAIKNNPYSDKAYNNKGILFHQQGKYNLALKQYDKALMLNASNSDIYYNKGLTCYMQGNMDLALKNFTKSIKLKKWNSLAYFYRAFIYRDKKDFLSASKEITKAISLSPKSAVFYVFRGKIFKNMNNTKYALQDFNRAIKLNINYADAYNERGIIYKSLGEDDDALESYNTAIKLSDKNAVVYNNRGNLFRKLGKEYLAFSDYSKAILIRPNTAIFYVNRAMILNSMNKISDAVKDLERAKLLGYKKIDILIDKLKIKEK